MANMPVPPDSEANDPALKGWVIELLTQAVPERAGEIRELWDTYRPNVVRFEDARKITLNANKERIAFDEKTLHVFWLIGFAGWKAISCYGPAVLGSYLESAPVAQVLKKDPGLDKVERDYKERLAAARVLIDSSDTTTVVWPPDIPTIDVVRTAAADSEFRAAFDLTWIAIAFTLFHEFRHVMLDRDRRRPADRREEELLCDVWAREMMTTKLEAYASANAIDYYPVLKVRSMALALSCLILHEITPIWDHGGSKEYFSVAARMQTLLGNTSLPEDDDFWVFTAALLIGAHRQKGVPIESPSLSPQELTMNLMANL